jgi:DNA-directed RNA polymerase subunit M/transcription elongation factor TFIIS
MEFCPTCENMLLTRLSSEDGEALTLYCPQCGTTQPGSATAGPVSSTLIRQRLQKPEYVAGAATATDPTLPIADSITCPACATAGRPPAPVVYVRYDASTIKYLYICTACPHRWNVENLGS